MQSFDAQLVNADWTKQSWDLPPYKSPEFMDLFPDLDHFRELPVYAAAVKSGLIIDDEWADSGQRAAAKFVKRMNRRSKTLPPVSQDRPAVHRTRKKLTRVIRGFFAEVKPRIIKQVVAKANRLLKADDNSDLDFIDEIAGEIDLTVFNQLPSRVQQLLDDAYADAGAVALDHVGVAVAANRTGDQELNPGAFDQVSLYATEYAEGRSAEMVGMKYVGDKLVPNPDAKWQITDSTREGIRGHVADVVSGRASVTELASTLSDSYTFSDSRAEMIARTEVHKANGEGALAGYQQSGAVDQKVWITSGDDDVSEDCQENEDEGPIGVDDEFPSGDLAEPAHPNCRCAIAAYVDWNAFNGADDAATED